MYQFKGRAQASQAAAYNDYIIGMFKTIGLQLVASFVALCSCGYTTYHIPHTIIILLNRKKSKLFFKKCDYFLNSGGLVFFRLPLESAQDKALALGMGRAPGRLWKPGCFKKVMAGLF
jgi:hypothetical protein